MTRFTCSTVMYRDPEAPHLTGVCEHASDFVRFPWSESHRGGCAAQAPFSRVQSTNKEKKIEKKTENKKGFSAFSAKTISLSLDWSQSCLSVSRELTSSLRSQGWRVGGESTEPRAADTQPLPTRHRATIDTAVCTVTGGSVSPDFQNTTSVPPTPDGTTTASHDAERKLNGNDDD